MNAAIRAVGDLSPRARTLAALTIGLAVAMSVLDGVMLNVGLPTIARSLEVSPSAAIWVINAYQLATALVMVPLGKAADTIGHRHVYLACIALFTFASAGCASSHNLLELSLWRFVQGCGGAGIVGVTNAMLRFTYPARMLAHGIAINSMVVALSLAAGPAIAALILEMVSWPWLFFVNLPIGLIMFSTGVLYLPRTTGAAQEFDWQSALLCVATFGALILAIDLRAHAASSFIASILGATGIGAGTLLVRRQLGRPMPLFPIDLLRTRMFSLSVGTMFGAAMAQIMAYVSLPFLLQHNMGRSPLETGLLFLSWPVALACTAPLASRLSQRHSAAILCSAGLSILAIGLLALTFLPDDAKNPAIIWRMAICGMGYGLFQPPSSRAMITSAPRARSGSASVMGATGRVLGQTIGAALVASLFEVFGASGPSAALTVAVAIAMLAAVASLFRGAEVERV